MFALLDILSSALTYDWTRKPTLTLEMVLSEFTLDNNTLRRMMGEMDKQMESGLISGLTYSSIAMLPSFVPCYFHDSEGQYYLAIDLGGTNLRVLMLDLGDIDEEEETRTESRNYRIPNAVMTGTGEELFGFIVLCLEKFLDEKGLMESNLNLGFTFSYPCYQKSLRSAVLVRWTKGFTATNVEGHDVGEILQDAINKNGKIKVQVAAIMNDTVGTQIATAYDFGDCDVAVVIATGTNASYMEKIENIKKLEVDPSYKHDRMIIDTEWGGFGDNGEIDFIKTQYDNTVDAGSVHPGVQSFDKLVAGMYMGEVIRLVVVKLVTNRLLFVNCSHGIIFTPNTFPTKYISEILNDEGGRLNNTRQVLEEVGIDGFQYSDLIILREICVCISRRSANLAAAAIACICLRIGKKRITVGIDGSTYRFHPYYHKWVKDKVKELLPAGLDIRLVQAGDGSGKGAALTAAIAEGLAMGKRFPTITPKVSVYSLHDD